MARKTYDTLKLTNSMTLTWIHLALEIVRAAVTITTNVLDYLKKRKSREGRLTVGPDRTESVRKFPGSSGARLTICRFITKSRRRGVKRRRKPRGQQ